MSFTCPLCGFTSHHPRDAAEQYCVRCHRFVDDPVFRRYEIAPHPAGGWRLRLVENEQEVGAGIFPADPFDESELDEAYADAMREGEHWLASR